ncbi:MAG: transglutaminase domain-containing protein [Anaerolineales bacterium]|nr:transglutaminase domain-containing protein [Anaerolineales bacterium]MCB0017614.1 transglutaminase domain-containing protein [Anaerolineales bacterium]MCB8961098.1 transglutaminase domain-containing protein [Ardenticatenales bacterium]
MLERLKLEEGWWTLFLVWAMVFVGSLAIRQADLITGLEILAVVATLSVFSGLLLAKSSFSPLKAHIFSLIYGLFVVTVLVGRQLPPDLVTWQARVLDMMQRQGEWVAKIFTDEASRDGLIFVMHTSAVYWILGYTAAWFTFRRRQTWLVILPSGLVLMSVIYYYYGPSRLGLFLAIYIWLALLYVAQEYLTGRELSWRSGAVRYDTGIRSSFVRAATVAGAIALGIAWTLPALPANAAIGTAFNDVTSPWRSFQDNWTRMFSALRSYGVGTNDTYSGSLTLSGPRTVGTTIIMDVFLDEQLPNVYWHGLALDTYSDGAWTMKETQTTLHYPEDGDLPLFDLEARRPVSHTIYNYIPNTSIVYGAPGLINADRQIYVNHTLASADSDLMNVQGIKSRYVMRQGDIYEVVSDVSWADAASLRAAGTNYPDWVTATYLQVPDSLTEDTLTLAAQLTEQYDNPFDKAIAVRNYLRANISYNDQIPAPPPDVEPIHYTLFISQEGYCNYYASAMAMMLRAEGVPTRIVQGFAQGEYNEEDQFYRVRAANAHTWVEVYFPEYGWIQFEPTASLPAADRPTGENGGNTGDAFFDQEPPGFFDAGELDDPLALDNERLRDLEDGLGIDEPLGQGFSLSQVSPRVWQISAGVLLLLLAYGTYFFAERWNSRIEADVTQSFGRLSWWANAIGLAVRPVQTPYERATVMAKAVPEGTQPISRLTRQYVLKSYGDNSRHDPFFNANNEWRVLRPLLLREAISQKFKRFTGRFRRKPRVTDAE